MQHLIIACAIGALAGLTLSAIPHTIEAENITPEYKTEPSLVVKEVWTKEAVIQRIRKEFPMAPVMVAVAKCESGFQPSAYNPTNGSHDGGIFQISKKYHGQAMKKLGLDPFNVEDNIKYAKILYDAEGLRPWRASNYCHHGLRG